MVKMPCPCCEKEVYALAKECAGCGFPVADYVKDKAAAEEASKLAKIIAEAAIRPDKLEGKVYISYTYNDLEIHVKYQMNDTCELIVNGMVLAEGKALAKEDIMKVRINEIYIKVITFGWENLSTLLINGEIVAQGKMFS